MQLERRFRRDVGALEAIFAFVDHFFTTSGLGAYDPSVVHLFVEEIFTDMVKYSQDGREDIAIRLRRRGDGVEIRMVDFDVAPFDYARAPVAELQQLLASGQSGGLGLHLVRTMADRLSYEYVGRNNVVIIEKRLGGAHVRHPAE